MNFSQLARGVFLGHTIYRVLMHEKVAQHCASLQGSVLDLAGDSKAAYRTLLPKEVAVQTLNVRAGEGELEGDFNKPLPFPDASFDAILFFNAIYIADNPVALLKECKRILKPGGVAYITSPFISNEMRDPHDYQRFTSEGLRRVAEESGFSIQVLEPFGERFTSAAYLLNPIWLIAPIRLVVYAIALLCDRLIPQKTRERYPAPLGYIVSLKAS